jgi:hypothetical protein
VLALQVLRPFRVDGQDALRHRDFHVLGRVYAGQLCPDHVPPVSDVLFHPHRLRRHRARCHERPLQPGEEVRGKACVLPMCQTSHLTTPSSVPVPLQPAQRCAVAAGRGRSPASPGPFAARRSRRSATATMPWPRSAAMRYHGRLNPIPGLPPGARGLARPAPMVVLPSPACVRPPRRRRADAAGRPGATVPYRWEQDASAGWGE